MSNEYPDIYTWGRRSEEIFSSVLFSSDEKYLVLSFYDQSFQVCYGGEGDRMDQ